MSKNAYSMGLRSFRSTAKSDYKKWQPFLFWLELIEQELPFGSSCSINCGYTLYAPHYRR